MDNADKGDKGEKGEGKYYNLLDSLLNGGSKIAEVQMTAQKLLENLEAITPISTSKPSA